jgi:hypothetical protein
METTTTTKAEVRTVEHPPRNFDFASASDTKLKLYGFPPRPKHNKKLMDLWERALLRRPITYIRPIFRERKKRIGRKDGEVQNIDINNWCGIQYTTDDPVDAWINSITAVWTIPNSYPPNGIPDDTATVSSSWIGISGDEFGGTVAQVGVDSSAYSHNGNTMHDIELWWEFFPQPINTLNKKFNVPVNAGDTVMCSICADTNGAVGDNDINIFFINMSTGVATSFYFTVQPTNPPMMLGGGQAECIVERYQTDTDSNVPRNPLSNYGEVYFSDIVVTTANNSNVDDKELINMIDENGNEISVADLFTDAAGVTAVKCQYVVPA